MTDETGNRPRYRVGLLRRGERDGHPSAAGRAERLGPLTSALRRLGVAVEAVAYQDRAIESVRQQLLGLDGVLVWVNPIQDGVNRLHLDALLRDVAAEGVWVSAHPDVILKLGTKEVLHRTRGVGWGSGTDLYQNHEELRARFPSALAKDTVRVLKQGRGNGGNGVWKVTLVDPTTGSDAPGPDAIVRLHHAKDREGADPEEVRLAVFFERCQEYFAWSGCLVDQPFQDRLADGLVRCYFVHDAIVGFCHQWPRALMEPATAAAVPPAPDSPFEDPASPAYRVLKHNVETRWMPKMMEALGLDPFSLPAIWDADFLYGPKTEGGEDTYVLCEINVSAVWPFPEHAVEPMARAVVARVASRGTIVADA